MAVLALLITLLALSLHSSLVAASTISTFSDSNCRKSLQSLPGSNGYPDGLCTQFRQQASSQYQSFMIVQLDYACAVTLYGQNVGSDPCSSKTLIVGSLGVCYNTSWVYYSIDNCLSPSLVPTTTPVTPVETSAQASPSESSGGGGGTNVGAIVGGVIGGLAFVAAIAGGALFFLWLQPKKKKKAAAAAAAASAAPTGGDVEDQKDKPPMEEVPRHEPSELSGTYVSEIPSPYHKDGGQHELPSHVPVELPDRQY